MARLLVITLLILVPQMATARVYMCVDQATGKASFTDRSCESAGTRAEVRVDPTNLDSGAQYAKRGKKKTWRSEADTRKSGSDYNADRRMLYKNKAAANIN